MKRLPTLPLLIFLPLATATGCGSDEESSGGVQPGPPPAVIDILVDSNRDGWVDADDDAGEDARDAGRGAVLLANLDDDDWDGVRDADDDRVNITADALGDQYDLATILVEPWPKAPDGAVGRLLLDAMSAPHVRLFLHHDDGSWQLVAGRDACPPGTAGCQPGLFELSAEQVVAGAQLGIEAATLVGLPEAMSVDEQGEPTPWDGLVQLDYAVLDPVDLAPIASEQNPDGFDRVVMRVAPWIDFGNVGDRFDTIFSNDVSAVFVQGVGQAVADAGIGYDKISNWGDHWTEDWMQTGYTSMPWADDPDGNPQVQGMRLAIPRPWGRTNSDAGLPVNWLKQPAPAGHLGFDSGYAVVYREPHTGDSYDSYGNHDVVPPYDNGDQHFPYGRIIHGSGVLPETHAFYEAQQVQAPVLTVKTSWLLVGHVDEVFSYVPAATPRGWKLLVASPDQAVALLQSWQAAGHGATPMFVGRRWADYSSAEITIDEVLADPDLMAWSQQAQVEIDSMVQTMKQEIGLADSEIVPIPVLFWQEYGGLVAYTAGAVNDLVFGDTIVVATPFGPDIDGQDGLAKDILDRLAGPTNELGSTGQGLKVYFADDWDWYHVLDGEVHCGTNQEGPPQASVRWWEAMP